MLEISEVCVIVVCLQTNKQTTTKKISLRMDVKQEEEPSSFVVFFVLFCFATMCQLQLFSPGRGWCRTPLRNHAI